MADCSANAQEIRTIKYVFQFDDLPRKEITLNFDNSTFQMIPETQSSPLPSWTKLTCCKCPHCPLDEKRHEFCPIAANMSNIVDCFSADILEKNALVTVTVPERKYCKRVSVKTAASSLLGIFMVTSGCPIMDKLKPMARFHLPFASIEETIYRSASTYLVAQHFLSEEDQEPDWEMKKMSLIYNDIEKVNKSFLARLEQGISDDSITSTLLTLECFAYYMNLSIQGNLFYDLEYLFSGGDSAKSSSAENTFDINYIFKFNNGDVKKFKLCIDKETLSLANKPEGPYPGWALLHCSQCSNCTLKENTDSHCPIARNMHDLVDFFKYSLSFKNAEVAVETEERSYISTVPLSSSISSLMGIYMATSGCPILSSLKTMVRFHLPFASSEETVFRTLSMYLLSQHFKRKKGLEPDWNVNSLSSLFENINIINSDFCSRLRNLNFEDASLNALIKLDCFAHAMKLTSNKACLDKIKSLFDAYLI